MCCTFEVLIKYYIELCVLQKISNSLQSGEMFTDFLFIDGCLNCALGYF
jgi:hypothetical protein